MSTRHTTALPARVFPPHALHAADRTWPETNCYLDLWIELLHAWDRDPLPLLGLAVGLDWEIDHFTFLKPSASNIFDLTGVTMHELALWDDTEAHVAVQVAAGSVALLEVDAFFLPDTRGDAYRHKHTKTTVGISAIDPAEAKLAYFHNAGHYSLSGEDYAGVLGRIPHRTELFPFAELARVAAEPVSQAAARDLAYQLLPRYARTRSLGNPVVRFAAALPELLARIGSDPARINALCFNTTRQLGSSFGLLAEHLKWLGEDYTDATLLAETCKPLQFQLSRAARRNRADPTIASTLDVLALAWERCTAALAPR